MSIHHALRAAGGSPSDPYFSNTVLLLQGNGSNGGQNNTFIDSSTNNFTITRNGNVTQGTFSPFTLAAGSEYNSSANGGSGYFDGSGDYLQISNNSAFNFGSSNFTIEAWIYPTSGSVDQQILAKNSGSYPGGYELNFYLTSGNKFAFASYGSSFFYAVSSGSISLNTWTHVAAVRNGSTITLYINGTADGTTTAQTIQTTSSDVTVGRDLESSGGGRYFNGMVSSLRVLKGTAQYTSSFTPSTAPLTAITNTSLLLNFTNGSILDSTAKNDLETVGDAQISTSTKKYGTGSLKFDGTGDALTIASNSNLQLGSSDFTVECWVNFSAIPSASGAASFVSQWKTVPSSNLSYFFYLFNSAGTYQLYLSYSTNGSNQTNLSVNLASAPSTGTWYHVAFVRNGSNFLVFWNGTQVGSTQTLSATLYNSTANVLIGGQEASGIDYPLNGYIDDLRITKGVARYTANFTAPTRQLPAR
jgi:hypothetical protein